MKIDDFLRENQEADLLRFTTAGSVDDGKSTLIGRLLSDCKSIYEDQLLAIEKDSRRLNRDGTDLALLLDGLKAEREQGITIDVAYRYFSTPKRRFIIADTPGHEQYTRNMATGASTADLAVILVDAQNGMLTQSRRHAFIASLLGIRHVVVAINKMDLIGYNENVYNQILADYGNFAVRLNIPDLSYVPISALKGENIVRRSSKMPWYQGMPLLSYLENVQIAGDRNLIDFRFPVQYVNRPNLNFRGYCGTIASGIVRIGDEVTVLPSRKTSRVKAILSYDGNLLYAFPPQSVTICLEGEIDISRGDMLVHPRNLPHIERVAEAMLVWMSESPLQTNTPYLVKQTNQMLRGVFTHLQYRINPNGLHRENATRLHLNEIGRVEIEFYRPVMFDEYSRNRATGSFIVIDPISNVTVGACMIIDRGRSRGTPVSHRSSPVSRNIGQEESLVTPMDRERLLKQKPATVWLTGLSGSGKSTIARNLEKALVGAGHACYALDGDNVRQGLNRDLGFTADERTENIRRVAEVAHLMNDAGLIVITSFISPYREDRRNAREIIGGERFIEVFVKAPLEICEKRDPKGLYKKARRGEIDAFTGVSAPYEEPEHADLSLPTHELTINETVTIIMEILSKRGILLTTGKLTAAE